MCGHLTLLLLLLLLLPLPLPLLLLLLPLLLLPPLLPLLALLPSLPQLPLRLPLLPVVLLPLLLLLRLLRRCPLPRHLQRPLPLRLQAQCPPHPFAGAWGSAAARQRPPPPPRLRQQLPRLRALSAETTPAASSCRHTRAAQSWRGSTLQVRVMDVGTHSVAMPARHPRNALLPAVLAPAQPYWAHLWCCRTETSSPVVLPH